ncbi:hypothetical protein WUBG_16600, partial [Wuchereria bancrofti]
KLYGRYLDSYYCGIFDIENDFVFDMHDHSRACTSTSKHCDHASHWQDVTVEMHSPPSMLLSSTPQKNQSALAVCCSTSRRTNDLAYIEHNSSNIVVTIDPSATDDTAVDVRPSAQDSGRIPDGFEKHAPLASLDIEFGTSSSSSSSNMKALNVDSSFTI